MSTSRREAWLDALRALSAFLVIVNHTNSRVFQASTPQEITWWASVAWYYVSRIAVPVFVLVSGATLLGRQESVGRALRRLGRILAALLVFSYGYYLYDAWVYWGLWPRMVNFRAFFEKVWSMNITDGFWYLYFYMGLMLLLPLLQRMAARMNEKQTFVWIAACFAVGALWPLAGHYVPALAMPEWFETMPVGYIGLLFAGHWIRRRYTPSKAKNGSALAALALGIVLSVWLTRLEFDRVAPGQKYWFMDNRWQPSLFIMLSAMALMMLAKAYVKPGARWTALGSCAFGVYLVQDWLIAQTETRLFEPLCQVLPAFAAVLAWEMIVFGIALAAVWVMRRIPVLKKLL